MVFSSELVRTSMDYCARQPRGLQNRLRPRKPSLGEKSGTIRVMTLSDVRQRRETILNILGRAGAGTFASLPSP